MSYAILDNNRYYAEGLRFSLLRRHPQAGVESQDIRWHSALLARNTLAIRCRFSITAAHQSLINILFRLEAARWEGSLYLVCNEKGWALATHLRKRFEMLTIYIIDDRIAVADAPYVLDKEPRRTRSLDSCLTGTEFNVLDLLISGIPVRHIAILTNMPEKQVSSHKCNALKKLNANNLLQLLL
ncbi:MULTISPECIES: LuxR C-terminal-related transcriptional regulator [Enterobacter]|uniref:LuxR C-terminal-related transcriptional regulator n=1 Tax=Enterobacter rongchengensis TaxID=3030999 RepID=A0ABV4JDD4_9ENTR|nr:MULTISPECIES: LuxR C-terminal-related transcriptional regulator [Enterobacter]PNL54727.1 LuxR family transcriptional regulator [Enterobacter hormaechei]HCR0841984.1 DNA-binding response regulator [Enterobacter cancerogenus]EKX4008043.1 DNA-binding response regulator [Enterobacter cloacae]ELV3042298.1 DNA-binding response regulator [Enterobacter chengduensis]KJL96780.1 LuxR family transcriptional regulator [Enterobacter chengduensis]